MDVACTNRIPEFFFITLMNSGGNILEELNMSHESGQAVADFTISVPQTVDVCSLHVRISGGNSAGVSAPCTAVVVGESQFSEIKFRKFETNMFSVL